MTDQTHLLYRFWDANNSLLYIGITRNPTQRWNTHEKSKTWWTEVATITTEPHPTRTAVLKAEKTAIRSECPRYNIAHNKREVTVPAPNKNHTRTRTMQPGDWGAFALADGRCPIGEIVAIDDTWITCRVVEWLLGCPTDEIELIRISDIRRAKLAYPEDAVDEGPWRRLPTEHLTQLQTGWTHHHNPDGDPVTRAYVDAQKKLEMESSR